MKLHQDVKLFSDLLRAASQHLDIKLEFVEKDYWITLILSRLANSKYVDESVFKGGTSLSKGYDLIDRFSEDVDIAIINNRDRTGNEVKTIIRTIEKEITAELNELQEKGKTSKGSRFRKSVYAYNGIEHGSANNRIIVEINSFANPFPFEKRIIKSMVYDFLIQTGYEKYIDLYDLQAFKVNVLGIKQTLLEKMVSLIRFSFKETPECVEFVASDEFKIQFYAILEHDKKIFEEPEGWQVKSVFQSPLMLDFTNIWEQLKEKYHTELSAYAYRPIPNETDISNCFRHLIERIA
jgi:predicted nucleotidyltransferase component of viral defense system